MVIDTIGTGAIYYMVKGLVLEIVKINQDNIYIEMAMINQNTTILLETII